MRKLAPVCTVAPAVAPVSLAEVKAHLRIDHADEDSVLTALIAAAARHLDGWTGVLGRALVTQTWRQDYPAFPAESWLRFPIEPVQGVTIVYRDAAGVEQTLDPETYSLHADVLGPVVLLHPGHDWPATAEAHDAVRVTAVCGYGDAASLPGDIRIAMLMMIGDWFEHRQSAVVGVSAAEVPMSVPVRMLLSSYIRQRVF